MNKWIKASERLPVAGKLVVFKSNGMYFTGEYWDEDVCRFIDVKDGTFCIKDVEWLEETEEPESKIVEFDSILNILSDLNRSLIRISNKHPDSVVMADFERIKVAQQILKKHSNLDQSQILKPSDESKIVLSAEEVKDFLSILNKHSDSRFCIPFPFNFKMLSDAVEEYASQFKTETKIADNVSEELHKDFIHYVITENQFVGAAVNMPLIVQAETLEELKKGMYELFESYKEILSKTQLVFEQKENTLKNFNPTHKENKSR
jgi:hypothetical protein